MKRESDSVDPEAKRSKSNTPAQNTEPAFDLGASGLSSKGSVSTPSDGTGSFPGETPAPFNSVGGIGEGMSLPKRSTPTTNLKRTEGSTATNGLALPKKDEKRKSKQPGKGSQALGQGSENALGTKPSQSDPNKMQDVLFSAGVDIREEEALLNSSMNASKSQAQTTNAKMPNRQAFLHPDQVSTYMRKICKEQSFAQSFGKNSEVLRIMSTACETYMRDIITNSLVISRHRRRAVTLNSGRRSEISSSLRSMALAQKKEEERRVKKRIALGLEKEDLENKMDSEETLHRASNATAGLRAGSKKQYGWLTSSTNKPSAMGSKTLGKVASAIAARGDSGLRFREAREEPGIVMRDLLYALENRRHGTHNVISKGYARIRD